MRNKTLLTAVLVLAVAGTVTGCGSSQKTETAAAPAEQKTAAEESTGEGAAEQTETAGEASGEVQVIRVANAAMPKPYAYVDDSGEVTGYDIDVIKAVFDYLPQYDMELTITEFPSILAGLDSGRYDLGINCLKYTEEREEKYLFSDPYLDDLSLMIVPADNTDINSLADLNGKSTIEVTGTVGGERMEDYSARNNANIQVNYSDADYSVLLQELADGKYDFMYLNRLTYEQLNESFHYDLRTFELTDEEKAEYNNGVDTELTYIMVSKTEEGQKLIDSVNEALAALKADGTLDEIALTYFGSADYVPK